MSLQRILLLFLLGAVLTTGAGAQQLLPGQFSDECRNEQYDCNLTLTPTADISDTSTVHLTLEWGDKKGHTRLEITRQTISIATVKNRKPNEIGCVKSAVLPGKPYQLTVMRRTGWLGVLHDEQFLFRGAVPRSKGALGGITADAGWTVDASTVQPREPVVFADDFMRTAENQLGAWSVTSGHWALQTAWDNAPHGSLPRFANVKYAQNPFAWSGRTDGKGSAICVTGKPYWEDYTLTTAVRPDYDGAVGVLVNMTAPDSGILVRWSSLTEHDPSGNSLIIYRLDHGVPTELARDRGGYLPDQWCKLSVSSSLDGVQVSIDGHPRLQVKDITPWRGGVGLYVEGTAAATFDDVTVYGHTMNMDLKLETRQSAIGTQFVNDPNGMKEWSINSNDWEPDAAAPAQKWYRWDTYGDYQWLTLTVKAPAAPGELWLVLNGSGKDANSGYRAVLQQSGARSKLNCSLFRATTLLATKEIEALDPNADFTIRLWRIGNRLSLQIDEREVLATVEEHPLDGLRMAYRLTGGFTLANDPLVLGHNMLDYNFTDAPVDWLGQGTWASSIRWSCSANWSFLSGWGRGDAALWHKQRFTGDQSLQAFIGVKMEYLREQDYYEQRFRDVAITICGDGDNPRSGYSAIYGAPGEDGTPNKRTVLMRNGVVVASRVESVASKGANHHHWFNLQLRKHGNTVEFWLEGALALSYTDPQPIDGGVPAIWTSNNGISLARARLFFANAPEPRIDPCAVVDDPWYPEWVNVDRPLTLDFPRSCSTSGKPVQLAVTKRQAPEEKDANTSVNGLQVSFTPRARGIHWYQVTSTDGTTKSAPFDIFLPAFTPALGRDDSHALVLYRFEEGSGLLIHDQSQVAPKADLVIQETDATKGMSFWLPGQGFTMHGPVPVTTAGAVAKLMKIQQTHACTLEFWVSTDTLYPPSGWAANLLDWETAGKEDNFQVGHYFSGAPGNVIFVPQGATFSANDPSMFTCAGFRTGLQHVVITWDGTTTSCYLNGKQIGTKNVEWNTAHWKPEALLTLGNLGTDFSRSYRGTFYLVAIHDRCFSAAEVQRHYDAGPSAK